MSFFTQVNNHHKLNKFENSRYLDVLYHRYRLKNTKQFLSHCVNVNISSIIFVFSLLFGEFLLGEHSLKFKWKVLKFYHNSVNRCKSVVHFRHMCALVMYWLCLGFERCTKMRLYVRLRRRSSHVKSIQKFHATRFSSHPKTLWNPMSQIKYSPQIFIIKKPECNNLRQINQAEY